MSLFVKMFTFICSEKISVFAASERLFMLECYDCNVKRSDFDWDLLHNLLIQTTALAFNKLGTQY